MKPQPEVILLPEPVIDGTLSVEEAMRRRRSERDYSGEAVTLAEVSQLLWAGQGVTDADGDRTAPSAGALFPLELHLATGKVEDLAPGHYRFRPASHDLVRISSSDLRKELVDAAWGQNWIRTAAAVVIITAVPRRTTGHYGERGKRYVNMEVGHAAQNIHLQAVSLDLGTVVVGAFEDRLVKKLLHLSRGEEPLVLMPVGRRNT